MKARKGVAGIAVRTVLVVAALLAAAFSLTGCEQVVAALLSDAPTGLEASDGDYADRIVLSWIGVSDTDADGNPRELSYYQVQRDTITVAPGPGTSTSYVDYGPPGGFTIGELYHYRVRAVFADAAPSDWAPLLSTETGYVMDARSILIHHVPSTYEYTLDGGGWFWFPAQEGWVYRVYATGSASPVRLLREDDLEAAEAPGGGPAVSDHDEYGTYYRYRTDSSREYYLQLSGSGTVSIVHE